MNDLFDTIPPKSHDDKLALLYEGSRNNLVAVNTSVGQSDRINIPLVVMQGGTWGPIKCSNRIDKIGKKCYASGNHLYLYKNRVRIMTLSMVDGIIAIYQC